MLLIVNQGRPCDLGCVKLCCWIKRIIKLWRSYSVTGNNTVHVFMINLNFVRNTFLYTIILLTIMPMTLFGWSNWHTLKTEHFTVIYPEGMERQGQEILSTMEYYRPRVEAFTNYEMKALPIVLSDNGLVVNGLANPVFNFIHLYTTPPMSGELAVVQNWWAAAGVHEYAHMLHLTKAGGWPGVIKSVFGNGFLPNMFSPGWLIEGIPVYIESQLSPYQGRINDGYFDAFMGANVSENRLPGVWKATAAPLEMPINGIYLYGGEFTDYLCMQYGESRLTEFLDVNGSRLGSLLSPVFPAFGIDRSAEKVYGKNLRGLWDEWIQYSKEHFAGYQPAGERLTNHGWWVENPLISNRKLYYNRLYPVKTGALRTHWFSEIMEYDIGRGIEKKILATTASITTSLKVIDNCLYYGLMEIKPGYANATQLSYGSYTVLHRMNLETGEDEVLFSGDILTISPQSNGDIIYSVLRKDQFGSVVFRHDPKTGLAVKLFDSDYMINEIISDKGKFWVSARKNWENFNLYSFSLEDGRLEPLFQTPWWTGRISRTGNRLYFSANEDGVYRSYSYDILNSNIYRLTGNGYVNSPVFDDYSAELYYVGVNSDGFDLYKTPVEFTPSEIGQYQPFVKPDLESVQVEVTRGDYRDNLKTLVPKIRYPFFYFAKDSTAIGVVVAGADAIGDFPMYTGVFQLDPGNMKLNASLDLTSNFFAPLQTTLLYNDFDEKRFGILASYPLFKHLTPGLSEIQLRGGVIGRDNYERTEYRFSVNNTFSYPGRKIRINIRDYLEDKALGSDLSRNGFFTDLGIRQYVYRSELDAQVSYLHDPDNPDVVFPRLRGYSGSSSAKVGFVSVMNFHLPLFQIRNGFWNPNIYWEDICGTLFWDYAATVNRRELSSFGAELHFETKIFFGFVPIDIGIRAVSNRESDESFEFFARSSILE